MGLQPLYGRQSVPPEPARRLHAFQFGKIKVADGAQSLRHGELGDDLEPLGLGESGEGGPLSVNAKP
jgi:hypothetical protein